MSGRGRRSVRRWGWALLAVAVAACSNAPPPSAGRATELSGTIGDPSIASVRAVTRSGRSTVARVSGGTFRLPIPEDRYSLALYDARQNAATFQGEMELLGTFTGECDAIAALRHAERNPPRPAPSPSPGSE